MVDLEAPDQHDTLPGISAPVLTREIFGHQDQASLLAANYQRGRLHHALLFEGPAGIGKATFAFHLAQHLISCPVCERAPAALQLLAEDSGDFRLLANGTHSQALHLTRAFDAKAEKFKTMLTVDEIRRISHFLSRTNTGAGYRVVIVDPVNDMNANAANALLKNLEEPPERTLFILIAHSAGRLLPTIRSRCQVIRFHPLSRQNMARALDEAQPRSKFVENELNALLQHSQGSVRRALMLTGFGGLEITDAADRVIASAVFDVEKAAKLSDAFTGRDTEIQFQLLTEHLMQRLAAAAARHAENNASQRAEIMAREHSETSRMLVEAQAYNLDKKQTIFGFLSALHEKSTMGLL